MSIMKRKNLNKSGKGLFWERTGFKTKKDNSENEKSDNPDKENSGYEKRYKLTILKRRYLK